MRNNQRGLAGKMALCALFSALVAVGAFIRFPLPLISFTLQTMFVALAGMLLGKKWGTFSVLLYIAVGLLGVPVFAHGGGPMYVMEPSFGFLLGFVPFAFLTGYFTEKLQVYSFKNLLLAQLPGLFAMYAAGLPYFFFISNVYLGSELGVGALLTYCFAATLPGDAVKCLLAGWMGTRLAPVLRGRVSAGNRQGT